LVVDITLSIQHFQRQTSWRQSFHFGPVNFCSVRRGLQRILVPQLPAPRDGVLTRTLGKNRLDSQLLASGQNDFQSTKWMATRRQATQHAIGQDQVIRRARREFENLSTAALKTDKSKQQLSLANLATNVGQRRGVEDPGQGNRHTQFNIQRNPISQLFEIGKQSLARVELRGLSGEKNASRFGLRPGGLQRAESSKVAIV